MSPDQPEASIVDLTLFELLSGGHYPNFIRLLLEAWADQGTGCVRTIVTKRFVDRHGFVFQGFNNVPGSPVRWVTLDDGDEAALCAVRAYSQGLAPRPRAGIHSSEDGLLTHYWALVEKYCRRFPARHILLMNLDEHLLALGAGRPAPALFSGIFFLPSYYYRSDRIDLAFNRRVFGALQERLVLRLLNHPQLRVAFFIDPYVAKSLQGKGTAQVVYLKDPVRLPEHYRTSAESALIRSRIGAPSGRKLFLLFGEITSRKGIWKLLDSLEKLTPQETARICLAIVGHADPVAEQQLVRRVKALEAATLVKIIRRTGYVHERALDDWFTAADVVLTPYLRHVGMSGVLLLAAAYRTPVISQDFGVMGRLTRENLLGLTADPSDPKDLARALRRFLGETPPPGFDPEVAYAFAKQQSHENFGETLLGALRPFMA